MTRLTITKAKDHIADLIDHSIREQKRIMIKKGNKKLAAIVPVEDLELIEKLEDRIDIEAAKKALLEDEEMTFDEIKEEFGLR